MKKAKDSTFEIIVDGESLSFPMMRLTAITIFSFFMGYIVGVMA